MKAQRRLAALLEEGTLERGGKGFWVKGLAQEKPCRHQAGFCLSGSLGCGLTAEGRSLFLLLNLGIETGFGGT